MSTLGRGLVDGQGAGRVIEAMLHHPLKARRANQADSRLLWEWVNDPEVRRITAGIVRAELEKAYEAELLTPWVAAERASISAVIEPADTRRELVAALDLLCTKRERLRPRRHDNTPL